MTPAVVVRGASMGFTVLVLGILVTPLVTMVVPEAAGPWPYIAGAAAFVLAGRRAAGTAGSPLLVGGLAAAGTYLLAVPFLVFGPVALAPGSLWTLACSALVIGPVAAVVRGSSRAARTGPGLVARSPEEVSA